MSDANVEDVFDADNSAELERENNNHEDIQEEKPAPRGYMSKEAWVEAGRDPDDWVSPEVFKERGERIKMKAELTREFDNRLKNISVFYEAQMAVQRNELMARRDTAIEEADKDAVKAIDKEIKKLDDIEQLNKQPENVVRKPQEVLEWEEENPWCNDVTDPRLALAQRVYKSAVESGKTPATALRLVDKEISAKFIDKSRKASQIAEGSRSSAGKADDGKPSMSTLTAEEKKIWESGLFESKESFLKAVQDDRKVKAGKK